MIAVDTTTAGILVTIPTVEVAPFQLDEVLRWLRRESATRCCAMSEAEADAIAETGKAQWWAENKSCAWSQVNFVFFHRRRRR